MTPTFNRTIRIFLEELNQTRDARSAKRAILAIKKKLTDDNRGYSTGKKEWEIQLKATYSDRDGDYDYIGQPLGSYKPKAGDEGYVVYYDDEGRNDEYFRITDDFRVMLTTWNDEGEEVEPLPTQSKKSADDSKIARNKKIIADVMKFFKVPNTVKVLYRNTFKYPKGVSGWAAHNGKTLKFTIGVDADITDVEYIAIHEITHFKAGTDEEHHNYDFYMALFNMFKQYAGFLPKEWVQEELDYKPRGARKALMDVTKIDNVEDALESLTSIK